MTHEDEKPKVKRMSIYINPNDTVVLDWLKRVTADGTSESKAMLDLIRRTERKEPSPVEEGLRQQIALLKELLREGASVPAAKSQGVPAGESKPLDAKIAIEGDWNF